MPPLFAVGLQASAVSHYFFQRQETPPTRSKLELPLADPMGQLKACQSDRRCPIRFEPHHRAASALDRAVILFDDVIEVRARAHEDVFPTMILATEPAQAQVTGLMAIERDLAGPSRRAGRNRPAEERSEEHT